MYKLKILKNNKWHWFKGNIYKISLVEIEEQASIFTEDEMRWFKVSYLDSPYDFDYVVYA
ncbi:MAG: hypothetical protein M3Z82_02485 [Apilactobacillus sp.]|nr:hypothetical protein [Apilactobacillus sp.]